jgi:hypothetical protein
MSEALSMVPENVGTTTESPEERKVRLRELIRERNLYLDVKDQFSDSRIRQAFDLPASLLREFIRQIESKPVKKPGEIKELRLYRFVLSGDPVELRPPTIEPEEKVVEATAPELDYGADVNIEERYSPRYKNIEVGIEEKAQEPDIQIIEKPAEEYSHSSSQGFEPADLDLIEKVQRPVKENPLTAVVQETEVLAKVDEPAKPEVVVSETESEVATENQPLFSVGGEVFWQGKKWKIAEVSVDGKYILKQKVVFGLVNKETADVPGKELEKAQFERAESAPAEVAKLFLPGQKFKFRLDDGTEAIFEITSRAGDMTFFGRYSIRKSDGSEKKLESQTINIQTLCKYLLGEKSEKPELEFSSAFPDQPSSHVLPKVSVRTDPKRRK